MSHLIYNWSVISLLFSNSSPFLMSNSSILSIDFSFCSILALCFSISWLSWLILILISFSLSFWSFIFCSFSLNFFLIASYSYFSKAFGSFDNLHALIFPSIWDNSFKIPSLSSIKSDRILSSVSNYSQSPSILVLISSFQVSMFDSFCN